MVNGLYGACPPVLVHAGLGAMKWPDAPAAPRAGRLFQNRRIPMGTSSYFAGSSLALVAVLSWVPSARAGDLNGAWASDASVCSKVFVSNNGKISFTPDAELYGAGLIIEGNRAQGALQNCKIKSMKHDGAEIRLTAACSTGVMVSDLEFTVIFTGNDQMTVGSAGPVGMETPLVRCAP
jgi:hypothetical protein